MAAKKTTGRITKRTKKLEVEPTPAQVIETFEVAAPAAVQAPIVQAPVVQAPVVQAPVEPAAGGAIPVAANDWVAVVYEGAAPHFDHDAGTFVRGTRTRLRAGLARRLLGRDGFRLA